MVHNYAHVIKFVRAVRNRENSPDFDSGSLYVLVALAALEGSGDMSWVPVWLCEGVVRVRHFKFNAKSTKPTVTCPRLSSCPKFAVGRGGGSGVQQ